MIFILGPTGEFVVSNYVFFLQFLLLMPDLSSGLALLTIQPYCSCHYPGVLET